MKMGSLFDGSGGFPLAAQICGIEPVWASEIESYPIRVTEKNFPNMRQLGDIRKINGGRIEPVDVITLGSPCQDLSIAGKRAGLGGERSGLFLEAIRIIREMRKATHGKYPTFIVWENVPGAFSSNRGKDFRKVIEEIAKIGDGDISIPEPDGKWKPAGAVLGKGCSLAWRVLDAQYWGVPQRRKRIFLVADFGGGRAGEILFKREGLQGDFKPGGAAEEATAGRIAQGAGAAGFTGKVGASAGIGYTPEGTPTLKALQETHVLVHPQIKGTLCASGAGLNRTAGQGKETDLCVCIQGNLADRETGMNGKGVSRGTVYTLNATDRHCICYGSQSFGSYKETKTSKTLKACDDITTGDLIAGPDLRNGRESRDRIGTLQSKENGGYSLNATHPVRIECLIRRLTPLECCRLQGFPDWWEEGLDGSDSARYRMWGNGVALPCVLYVMEGIAAEELARYLKEENEEW